MSRGPWVHAQTRPAITLNTFGAPAGFGPPATRAFEMFNKANEGRIHVASVVVPWEAHYEKQMAELVAKTTAFDFFPVISFWKGAMVNHFEDLAPYAAKHGTRLEVFPKQLLDICRYQGRLWSLPFRYGAGDLFYYRTDLYAKAGAKTPTNLTGLLESCRRLTGDGVYGMGMMFGGHPSVAEEFMVWFLALGGRLVNDEQNNITDPKSKHTELAAEILSTWKELLDKKLLPPGVLGWVFTDLLNGFSQGLIAQATMLSARVGLVEDPAKSRVSGRVGYAPMFPGPGLVGPRGDWAVLWSYAINKYISAERKEAAYKAIEFITGFEAQKEAALSYANGPTRLDVLDSTEYQRKDAAHKAVRQMMEGAYTMWFPEYWEVLTAVSDEVGRVLIGKKMPKAATTDIWARAGQIIRKA
jgi:ABC-type glycerol-3-phosphate transport system substrate-binding protein